MRAATELSAGRRASLYRIALGVGLLCLPLASARAANGAREGLQSWSLQTAYGFGDRHNLNFVSLLPRISLFLPAIVDRPLSARHWEGTWASEAVVSYITNSTETVEAGITPIVLAVRYDRGQSVVPFAEAGQGLLYTDLRNEALGQHVLSSSQLGGGVHWFLDERVALSLSVRVRHISNAGVSHPNKGLNTTFVVLGVAWYPRR
jgi:hypothetical protein